MKITALLYTFPNFFFSSVYVKSQALFKLKFCPNISFLLVNLENLKFLKYLKTMINFKVNKEERID